MILSFIIPRETADFLVQEISADGHDRGDGDQCLWPLQGRAFASVAFYTLNLEDIGSWIGHGDELRIIQLCLKVTSRSSRSIRREEALRRSTTDGQYYMPRR
jgi:hypothetical protein